MTIPNILDEDHTDAAAQLLRAYYNDLFASEMPRTGSRFDSWAGGGDAAGVANRVVADDLKWLSALTDGTGLTHRLQEIRKLSGISDPISDIRAMDIVLWMYGKETAAS